MPASARPKGENSSLRRKAIGRHQTGQGEPEENPFVFQVEQSGIGLEIEVQAIGAAQRLDVKEQEIHHLRKRHGDHDEVDAVRADDKKADQQGRQRGRPYSKRQCPPQADRLARRRHEGEGIAGEAKERGVAERHQAGDTLQQVQTHREDGHDHHAGDQPDGVVGAEHRHGREADQGDGQHQREAARQGFQLGFGGAHGRLFRL
jgi:hypothetical protein